LLPFILRRLAWAAAVVFGTAVIAFGGIRALRPELFPGVGLLDGLRHDLSNVFLHWELGSASFLYSHPLNTQVVRQGWQPDLLLLLGTFLIGVTAGLSGAIYCANRRGRPTARVLEWLAMFFFCTPVYVVGLTLILFFSPPFGTWEIPALFELHTYISPFDEPLTFLRAMLVPWLVTAAPLAAVVLRLSLSAITDVMEEDYIRTAQGKGLTRHQAVRHHAAPAAFLPVASLVSVSVPLVVTNMVLVEIVFNVPGVFRYLKKAIEGPTPPGPVPDYLSLQIYAIYAAAFIVIGTLIADLFVARLDPRIRTGERTLT
jgi:peptide/nickel transport system permease protein